MLEVRFSGKFDVQYDGQPVIIASRAAQSLFAYLILTAGTLHRREKLAGMLWPDESEQKARTFLCNELWRVRKALSPTSKVEYFLADNLTIAFNPSSAYWLDVAAFKNISDSASADELITELSYYEHELLPGFYEDWVLLEREHLQVLFEQKIACLLDMLEKEKRWDAILEWAERWLSLGQASETPYRSLMIAYDALGDHGKVTSTYERCKQALRQLDLEPSDETRALAFKKSSKIKFPIPLTSFVGREKELKEVVGLFAKSRLITLTGSGGVGKTRLAIQVVAEILDRFPDGVWFLDLAPLTDPALIPNTLANLLGLRESGEIPVTELLINYFRSRRTLVIFDNCEHLIEACAQLINLLLTSCENLTILATSREILRVSGEFPYRVPSLEIPRSDIGAAVEPLTKVESVQLFIQRAALAAPNFAKNSQNVHVIAEICQRLDGIPLALELAAARINVLTPEQILKHLENRFDLLTNGLRSSLPRHQTLRATIEWSYSLLTTQERLLLERLSIFEGGWYLEAAEEVCKGDGIKSLQILDLLTQLFNKSLILAQHQHGQETCYRMLETVRQYASKKLWETGERELLRQRHLAYFVDLAERAEPNLRAFDMVMWLDRLEAELDDIRSALEWARDRDVEAQLKLAGDLLWFWHIRGHKNEGIDWLEQALAIEVIKRGDQPLTFSRALIRGKALNAAGFLRLMLEETDKGAVLLEESLTLFRGLGTIGRQGMAYALLNLSHVALNGLDLRQQKALLEESLTLFQELGDKLGEAECINNLGDCAAIQGDYKQARIFLEQHLALRQEIGDKDGTALALLALGNLASRQGNHNQATVHYETSLSLFRHVENTFFTAAALRNLGVASWAQDDYEQAVRYFEEALDLSREFENKLETALITYGLGRVAHSRGKSTSARQLYWQSIAIFCKLDDLADRSQGVAQCLEALALMAATQKRATCLFSVSQKLYIPLRFEMSAKERTEHDETIATARAVLGEEAFFTAWEEGQRMTMEEAIAYAVESI